MAVSRTAHFRSYTTPERCKRCGHPRLEKEGVDRFYENVNGERVLTQEHAFLEADDSAPEGFTKCVSDAKWKLKQLSDDAAKRRRWPGGR